MSDILSELKVLIGADSTPLNQAFDRTLGQASSWSGKISSIVGGISFAAVGAGILAVANTFDQARVQIARSTGAVGEKLAGLEKSFDAVYKTSTASSTAVADALSIISSRTGATGQALEDLTRKTISLAKTQREDVVAIVPVITRMFGDWSIATTKTAGSMDFLRVTSQQTGSKVGDLAALLVHSGAPLRQLGYDFEHATTLIGKFQKEGVNTELVLGAMKAILGKFAKEGVQDTAAAWQDFIGKVQAGKVGLADIAQTAGEFGVGRRAAVDLFRAVVEGRFAIDDTVKSYKTLAEEGSASVETLKGKLILLQRQVESVIAAHKDLIIAVGLVAPGVIAGFRVISPAVIAFIASLTGPAGATVALSSVARYSQLCGGQVAAAGAVAAAGWAWLTLGVLAAAGSIAYAINTRPKTGKVAGFVPGMSAERTPTAPRGAPDAPAFAYEGSSVTPAPDAPPPPPSVPKVAKDTDKYRSMVDHSMTDYSALIAQYRLEESALRDLAQAAAKYNQENGTSLTTDQYRVMRFNELGEAVQRASVDVSEFSNYQADLGPETKSIYDGMAPSLDKCDKLIKELAADTNKATKAMLDGTSFAKVAALQREIATETQRLTNNMFRSLEQGIGSSIAHWRGLGQAVKGIFQTLGQDVLGIMLHAILKPVEKLLGDILTKIATKLLSVFITQKVGASAVDVAQVGGEAAVGGAAAMASIAAIPIIGPMMAPAAGAAMYAAILGTFGPLALFSQGGIAGYDNTPGLFNKEEMVLPADISVPLRSMIRSQNAVGSGGGVRFEGCTFSGVTKDLVKAVFSSGIRQARLAGMNA